MAAFKLNVAQFPDSLQPVLKQIDDEGDGNLELDELTEVFTMYADMKAAAKDGSIAISTLPKELQPTLKVFDVDGDGTVAALELARAAELYKESKNNVKRLTKLALVLGGLLVVMLAAIGGLTAWVVEASKETKTDASGVTMVAGTDSVASTGTAVEAVMVADAAELSDFELAIFTTMRFATDEMTINLNVIGWTRTEADGLVTFSTATGHSVTVDVDKKILVTSASGDLVYDSTTADAERRRLLCYIDQSYSPVSSNAGGNSRRRNLLTRMLLRRGGGGCGGMAIGSSVSYMSSNAGGNS